LASLRYQKKKKKKKKKRLLTTEHEHLLKLCFVLGIIVPTEIIH
jgi:hypothetical protein